jgi:hypothetical protein
VLVDIYYFAVSDHRIIVVAFTKAGMVSRLGK